MGEWGGGEEGEFTFTGGRGGDTVIDYILGDEDTRRWVKKLEIGDNVDSDHQPFRVSVGGEKRREVERKGKRRKKRKDWTEIGREKLREGIEGLEIGEGGVEEEMRRGVGKIRVTMESQGEEVEEEGKRSRGW